jgi:hypothetical protein
MKNKGIFLIAHYHMKPRNPTQTFKVGYISDLDNVTYDESINITRGLRNKDIASSGVIMNLSEQKVIKNGFHSNSNFAELLEHYQKGYPEYINPLIAQLYPELLNEAKVNVPSEEKESS